MDTFDEDDLAALRRLGKHDERSNRKKSDGVRRGASVSVVQLNVRVRPEVSNKARQIAERTNSTIAEVVERAIEDLFARGGAVE